MAYTNALTTKPKGCELSHIHHGLREEWRNYGILTEIRGELWKFMMFLAST